MIIDRLPPCVQRFFSPMASEVSKPRSAHLWSLVLAMAVSLRAAKLAHLSAAAPTGGHRTSRGAFLSRSGWDAPGLVERAGSDLLASMEPRAGEVAYLILDDTRIPKRGRRMGYVSKIWDPKQQRFVRGHVALTAAVLFRGAVLPWRVELWEPEGLPGPRYRKLTDLAAAMAKAFQPPDGVKVRVLFDAFYLCPTVTKACEAKGFTFFSVASRNRNFTTGGGGRRSIAGLMPGLVRHRGKGVRMRRSRRRRATLRLASADGHLSRVGRVRMVVSKRPRGPWKTCIAVVTSETGLRPRQVVAIHESRWPIEVLFKGPRQDLGPGDYQMIAEEGTLRHLHVCCLAHQMLTPPVPERARCQSQEGEPASHAAAHEPTPPDAAHADRRGPHRATCERTEA